MGYDRKAPDDVDTCCGIRGNRCICLPYDDGFAILAQILTIIALFFSWVWWATLIICLVGMILFQIFWCCRQTSCSIYVPTAYEKYEIEYEAIAELTDDDDYINYLINIDHCRETTWGIIATICSALWAGAAFCLFWFVKSGRHARWEKIHSGSATSNDVELANASPGLEESPVVVADGAILPPEPMDNKVDDV